MNNVRVRIAPSPTGEDLHIGNVYTALINFVFARKNKGKFIVRIEDTDRTRLIAGAEGRILKSLAWFGLKFDEGPYHQSERLSIYQKYASELIKKGSAYYCFCTPERLKTLREEQAKQKKPTLYDGHCLKLNKKQIEDNKKKTTFVIRMKVPEEGKTEFIDVVRGKISFANKLIDDQIIIKSDGYPTYHLAVVVDDYLMNITHVIRAEEWISSTPKHVLLYKYFDWPLPIFAHGPILRNPDKSKLSKRKNPVWSSWYKSNGYLPEAILNYLALMGWSMPDGKEIFTVEEMQQYFRLEDLKTVGPAFDIKKLDWLNGEYIRKTQNSMLKTQIWEFLGKKYPSDLIEKTIPLVKERLKKLSDYLPLCEFFYRKPEKYEVDLAPKQTVLKNIYTTLKSLDPWNADSIGNSMQHLAAKMKIKNSEFFMILRVAVTGKKISPPLNESMEILGKDEVLERLKNANR